MEYFFFHLHIELMILRDLELKANHDKDDKD
jgi:hypothetical protein